jgi:hypothetical protein
MPDISDSTTRTNLGTAMGCATDATTIAATLRARAKSLRISGARGKDTASVAAALEDLATRIGTIEAHNQFVISQADPAVPKLTLSARQNSPAPSA